jgi:hypothetical protein
MWCGTVPLAPKSVEVVQTALPVASGWSIVPLCAHSMGPLSCATVSSKRRVRVLKSDLFACLQIREEARKQQEELERILEENKRRVEAAQAAAAAAAAATGPPGAAAGDGGKGLGSKSTSAANPLLQRPSGRSGSGLVLVE